MLLEARDITFCYDKNNRKILENFHLQVESQERVGLVAPSGFGKTTLCKILAGYEDVLPATAVQEGYFIQEFKVREQNG